MGDTPRTDAILDLQSNDGFGLEKSQCIAQWYDHSALLERELASLRAECDKWKGQIKEWQAANIQLGQRAERAEHELKDWGELFSAAMCAGIPDRTNLPLLIKEIWPNEWHQDCAAVSFLIKEVYGRAERAEAERDAAVKDAERYRELKTFALPRYAIRVESGDVPSKYRVDDYQVCANSWEEMDATLDAAIAARKGEQ